MASHDGKWRDASQSVSEQVIYSEDDIEDEGSPEVTVYWQALIGGGKIRGGGSVSQTGGSSMPKIKRLIKKYLGDQAVADMDPSEEIEGGTDGTLQAGKLSGKTLVRFLLKTKNST